MVLITAPVDRDLGDNPQPFTYDLPLGHANPVWELVFDKNPIASVVFCIDGNVSCSEMQPIDGGHLRQDSWDSTTVVGDLHTIVVRAEGTTSAEDRIGADEHTNYCMGDFEADGDVDGSDLAEMIIEGKTLDLAVVAGEFGRNNCL